MHSFRHPTNTLRLTLHHTQLITNNTQHTVHSLEQRLVCRKGSHTDQPRARTVAVFDAAAGDTTQVDTGQAGQQLAGVGGEGREAEVRVLWVYWVQWVQ